MRSSSGMEVCDITVGLSPGVLAMGGVRHHYGLLRGSGSYLSLELSCLRSTARLGSTEGSLSACCLEGCELSG